MNPLSILTFVTGNIVPILIGLVMSGLLAFGLYWKHEYNVEHTAFDGFKIEVASAGAKQNQKAVDDAKAQLKVTERATYDHQQREAGYGGKLADLRGELRRQASDPGSSILRGVSGSPGPDPDRVCFSRVALDRGFEESLGRFSERLIQSAARGDTAISLVTLVKDWGVQQKEILK